jgi:hypothetical protein
MSRVQSPKGAKGTYSNLCRIISLTRESGRARLASIERTTRVRTLHATASGENIASKLSLARPDHGMGTVSSLSTFCYQIKVPLFLP